MRPLLMNAKAVALTSFALALLLVGGTGNAAAHTHLTVGPTNTEYGLNVGWRVEPPVVGVLNGLDLYINYTSNDTAYEGAEATLTSVLSYGAYSVTKVIATNDRGPGWYTFDVLPTKSGAYAVRLMGTLRGWHLDVNVTLDDVEARSTVEFPLTDPTPSDLQAANAALQAQVGTAMLVAAVGVVVGLVGLGVGVAAMRRSRPKP